MLGHERTVTRPDAMTGAFLGPSWTDEEIAAWLDERGYPYQRLAPGERGPVVAEHVARGDVVGLFQGRMEFGPRALGHRSIIGDPRSPEMQSVMNLKIKYRESFRPVRPRRARGARRRLLRPRRPVALHAASWPTSARTAGVTGRPAP